MIADEKEIFRRITMAKYASFDLSTACFGCAEGERAIVYFFRKERYAVLAYIQN